MNDKRKTVDQIPYTITIRDADDAATWRAYPAQCTTIQELYRACKDFDLIAWVDLDNEVCLIPRDMTRQEPLPDSCALVMSMHKTADVVKANLPVGPHDRSWCG